MSNGVKRDPGWLQKQQLQRLPSAVVSGVAVSGALCVPEEQLQRQEALQEHSLALNGRFVATHATVAAS